MVISDPVVKEEIGVPALLEHLVVAASSYYIDGGARIRVGVAVKEGVLLIATIGFLCDVLLVEVPHVDVVELVPFPLALTDLPVVDDRIVVAAVSYPEMYDDTHQFVLEVLWGVLLLLILLVTLLLLAVLLFLQTLLGVRLEVELKGEFAEVVQFALLHGIEVEFEPFEHENQVFGQLLQALPFERVDLLVTLLTVVGVVAL